MNFMNNQFWNQTYASFGSFVSIFSKGVDMTINKFRSQAYKLFEDGYSFDNHVDGVSFNKFMNAIDSQIKYEAILFDKDHYIDAFTAREIMELKNNEFTGKAYALFQGNYTFTAYNINSKEQLSLIDFVNQIDSQIKYDALVFDRDHKIVFMEAQVIIQLKENAFSLKAYALFQNGYTFNNTHNSPNKISLSEFVNAIDSEIKYNALASCPKSKRVFNEDAIELMKLAENEFSGKAYALFQNDYKLPVGNLIEFVNEINSEIRYNALLADADHTIWGNEAEAIMQLEEVEAVICN